MQRQWIQKTNHHWLDAGFSFVCHWTSGDLVFGTGLQKSQIGRGEDDDDDDDDDDVDEDE